MGKGGGKGKGGKGGREGREISLEIWGGASVPKD